LLSIPFEVLYNIEIRPPTNKEMISELNEIKGKLNE